MARMDQHINPMSEIHDLDTRPQNNVAQINETYFPFKQKNHVTNRTINVNIIHNSLFWMKVKKICAANSSNMMCANYNSHCVVFQVNEDLRRCKTYHATLPNQVLEMVEFSINTSQSFGMRF